MNVSVLCGNKFKRYEQPQRQVLAKEFPNVLGEYSGLSQQLSQTHLALVMWVA